MNSFIANQKNKRKIQPIAKENTLVYRQINWNPANMRNILADTFSYYLFYPKQRHLLLMEKTVICFAILHIFLTFSRFY